MSWRDIDYFVAAMNDGLSLSYKKFLPGTTSFPRWVKDVNNDNRVSCRHMTRFVGMMNMTCPQP